MGRLRDLFSWLRRETAPTQDYQIGIPFDRYRSSLVPTGKQYNFTIRKATMSPAELAIVLWYYAHADDHEHADRPMLMDRLLGDGLLELQKSGLALSKGAARYRITARGNAFVKALMEVPLAVQEWRTPWEQVAKAPANPFDFVPFDSPRAPSRSSVDLVEEIVGRVRKVYDDIDAALDGPGVQKDAARCSATTSAVFGGPYRCIHPKSHLGAHAFDGPAKAEMEMLRQAGAYDLHKKAAAEPDGYRDGARVEPVRGCLCSECANLRRLMEETQKNAQATEAARCTATLFPAFPSNISFTGDCRCYLKAGHTGPHALNLGTGTYAEDGFDFVAKAPEPKPEQPRCPVVSHGRFDVRCDGPEGHTGPCHFERFNEPPDTALIRCSLHLNGVRCVRPMNHQGDCAFG